MRQIKDESGLYFSGLVLKHAEIENSEFITIADCEFYPDKD